MLADIGAAFCCASNPLLMLLRRFYVSSRSLTARRLIVVMLPAVLFFTSPGNCTEAKQPEFQKLFHLVGIPGLRRDERVNLTTNADGFLFETKQTQYQVPYTRFRQVLLLRADRRYEGRTYAAAVATYGVGALLILKKHHVDTVILDYVNERGGKMGIVVQMETAQGEHLAELLQQRGISITDPEQVSDSSEKEVSEGNSAKRSKQ
jgi:hypothetical protein